MENIAWEYLEPIEQAQLLHCRPDLREGKEKAERLPGRPALLTIEQIRQRAALEVLRQMREEMATNGNNLNALKELYKLRKGRDY